ncbi:transposase [Francisella hispaniensis]|uniref:transposase n=1 Tax=Francisella hispaniensis TaxID=622488 RepID=UPI001904AA00|nr:transposase [Francisella hispaniensis]MBK2357802.1 transposase [Francisella hispaniensis]
MLKFRFLNHRNSRHQNLELTMDEFLERFIKHIPEKDFRMIRYYGFLSNSIRGKLLPKIYQLLGQKLKVKFDISYQPMSLLSFNVDPLKCILITYII